MRYIIVTGGELRNKGAQAMTFVTVNEMAKRYPNHQVVLLSSGDSKRPAEEKENYRFRIVKPMSGKEFLILSNPAACALYRTFRRSKQFEKFYEIFSNADAILDISGFALSADWGNGRMLTFALPFLAAKRFRIPANVMPQSFGPFDFKGLKGRFTKYLLGKALRYSHVVMAREAEGEAFLKEEFSLTNVAKTSDLVLQNTGIDMDTIYHTIPQQPFFFVQPSSVAIIPNKKNSKYGTQSEILAAYKAAIGWMLKKKKFVYLIAHALEDQAICREIKAQFPDNDKVICVEQELSCLVFDSIVGLFDYVIASRFHSVVHAYKNNVPAVILGWATKYRELSQSVGQESYQFDVRQGIRADQLVSVVQTMEDSFAKESETIAKHMETIRTQNVFDLIQVREQESK